MGAGFWIGRWLLVFVASVAIIGASHLLRSRGWPYAVEQGLLWGAITASVYLTGLAYRMRRAVRCATCIDIPRPK